MRRVSGILFGLIAFIVEQNQLIVAIAFLTFQKFGLKIRVLAAYASCQGG
jgi:hypothetical protein